jgi:hypothetical protein
VTAERLGGEEASGASEQGGQGDNANLRHVLLSLANPWPRFPTERPLIGRIIRQPTAGGPKFLLASLPSAPSTRRILLLETSRRQISDNRRLTGIDWRQARQDTAAPVS